MTWANTGVAAVFKWNRIMSWSININSHCLSLQKHFASIPIQCLRQCQSHFSDVTVKSIQVRSLTLLRSETSSSMSDRHFSWPEVGHVLSIVNSGNVSDYRRSRIPYIWKRVDFFLRTSDALLQSQMKSNDTILRSQRIDMTRIDEVQLCFRNLSLTTTIVSTSSCM